MHNNNMSFEYIIFMYISRGEKKTLHEYLSIIKLYVKFFINISKMG